MQKIETTRNAEDRDDEKPNYASWRHKGCFASKRRIQSVTNLARAQQCQTEVKENHPEEEIDVEPPRKWKRGHRYVVQAPTIYCCAADTVANVGSNAAN